jgi:hypothetical protein
VRLLRRGCKKAALPPLCVAFAPERTENPITQRYTGEMDLKLVSRTLILAVAGGLFSLTAFAQWQWIDKDGRKVYSDRSPPTDIPEKNILKGPRGARMTVTPVPTDDPVAGAPAAVAKNSANTPKLTGKDAQLEAKKKQAEEEEAGKKQAEADKVAQAKADNCDRAKKSLAGFQSGQRIPITNAKGERDYMDDNTRAAETKRLQGIVGDCK